MEPVTSPTPIRRSTGATWVGATGAFLLVAAAGVFVAVRWHTLPDAAKLALVAALTGTFLAGGRALGRTLPASGDVLFHLGAFLVPVDVADLALRAGVGWRVLVVAEGAAGVAALGALAAASASVVLCWATAASTVVLAAGVAAVSPVPAALALSVAALAASLLGRRRPAVAWALVAGLAPVLGVVAAGVRSLLGSGVGTGVLAELGLAGDAQGILAVASGGLAALVLGREARARDDLGLAALAAGSLLVGAATTWGAAEMDGRTQLVAAPAAFLVLEVVALLARRDPFWRRPAGAVATGAEVLGAVVGGAITAGLVLFAPLVEEGLDLFSDAPGRRPDRLGGLALGLLAVAWLLAGARRLPAGGSLRSPAGADGRLAAAAGPVPGAAGVPAALPGGPVLGAVVAFAALAAVAAVEVATASAVATAAGLAGAAAGLALSRTLPGHLLAPLAAAWGTVVVWDHPVAAVAAGLLGAAAVAEAAVARSRAATPASLGLAHAPAVAAALTAVLGAAFGADALRPGPAMALAVVATWALAADLDRGRGSTRAGRASLGDGARAAMLVAVAGAASLAPVAALPGVARPPCSSASTPSASAARWWASAPPPPSRSWCSSWAAWPVSTSPRSA